MPSPKRDNGSLLALISDQRPAGEDLGASEDWVKIRAARPNLSDSESKGMWTPVETAKSSWELLGTLSANALERKSKDLRIAIWLAESDIRLFGFAGLRDSLGLIRELLDRFWDRGLWPSIEDGDLEMRSGPLEWLNEKLADLLRETPLTQRTDTGDDYSYAYYQESRRQEGKISVADFETAVRATPLAFVEATYKELLEAIGEMAHFNAICAEKFGSFAPSVNESTTALGEIRVLLERILRDKRPSSSPAAPEAKPGESTLPSNMPVGTFQDLGFSASHGSSWENAERLARSGKPDEALAEMTRLAAAEGTGRARFQRKLVLADICLSTKRDRLAKVVLEELAEAIEVHKLEAWETSEVVGAVWSRLYGCYRNEKAGTADEEKASVLFLKLCRLDPWQALRCNDLRT